MGISFMFAKCRIHCTSVVEMPNWIVSFLMASVDSPIGWCNTRRDAIDPARSFFTRFIVFSLDFEKRSYGHRLSFD